MKFFIIAALFAFVAIQLSNSAPTPDEDKKGEAATPVLAAESPSSPTAVAEVKSADPEAATSAAAAAPIDEKKAA
ncbi:unnamed protein product, partial [Iphiclides podalirius]